MVNWWFAKQPKGVVHQDSVLGEFFATESIDNIADSLVREFIQNSLDATSPSQQLEVRFSVGTMTGAISAKYTSGLFDHIAELDSNAAALLGNDARYLVAEDFGTHGLRGDPEEEFRTPTKEYHRKNDFYYFIRSQGASEKSSTDRGSWGVGKFTFPMASQINSLFALTIRQDQSEPGGVGPLLVGQCFLNNHQIDGVVYPPHGWWSDRVGSGVETFPVPFTGNNEHLASFAADFGLARTSEPGLSVVVPHVHDEMSRQSILKSVLRNYSASILLGQLQVTVNEVGGESTLLTAENLLEVAQAAAEDVWTSIRGEVELLKWWANEGRLDPVLLPQPPTGDQTSWKARMSDTDRDQIQQKLSSGERVVVRVPVHVAPRPKAKVDGVSEPTWSFTDVILQPDDEGASSSTYYREGLRISNVGGNKAVGVRAITIVEDAPLASMLALAEGPAHVDWTARGTRFSGKFADGRNVIAFVKNAAANVVKAARNADSEQGVNLAGDIFHLNPVKGPTGNTDTGNGKEEGDPPVVDPPEPVPHDVIVDQRRRGFVVTAPKVSAQTTLRVELAYDVRRGNPFKKWKPLDFTIPDLKIDLESGVMTGHQDCAFIVEVTDPECFRVEVSGLDPNRDLIVKAEVKA